MLLLTNAFHLALLAIVAPSPFVSAGNVQKSGLQLPASAATNKAQVVTMFTDAYSVYQKVAFGHDDLEPVSLSFDDSRNGWGATIVDGMSTMLVMGLTDLYQQAVQFAGTIDFNQSNVPSETVSVFETTIRFVGGFLSAYQLNGEQDKILLEKAQQVADKLAFAWVGNNDVPFGELNFTTNEPIVAASNIAEAGTLTLEWTLLSQLTGNQTYADLAQKSVKHIASLGTQLPGLAAQGIDPSSGEAVGSYVTWSGGSDSYFEYLIKFPRLFPNSDPIFATTWLTAVDSSIKTLKKTSTVGGHVYLADFDGTQIRHIGSHLACFHAGNWILGGKLLNNDTIVDVALELADACWNTYASTATGIGPETFAWISSDGSFTGGDAPSASDLSFYSKNGFYITGSDYILRPEVLESNFYAWRATGDTKYLDRAESAIESVNKFLEVNNAFAGINDVNNANGGGGFIDDTESFFFAEVLKYLYLTFDDPNHISIDEFVFNTECHPFKAGPAEINISHSPPKTSPLPSSPLNLPLPQISPNPRLPNPFSSILGLL
ncbi:glycoside hydrolase family 47 protein [Sistotremastrum niveocremeum HHB9708]|uniref:alpha-1,2-Mannosidase n=1 Tax=Sistotremastrum niveocremeum HHB9708 TaxID=1314777 RepID=A0A164XUX8_9AGAM|nr:glycoside hydrolase family 47 protein [Sistotremastrum niveocremeum HHB9708]